MMTESAIEFSDWTQRVVEWIPEDVGLPGGLDTVNLTLNRRRLAEFLEAFVSDSDVHDLLLLDLVGVQTSAEISSTGEIEQVADLSLRPFRLWEYIWLYKVLSLSQGGQSVLDLGGPASHVVISAALAGNRVHSVDLNPRIVEAGRECAKTFRLENYRAEVGDMRDLTGIASGSVDRIVCCSVLEHLTAADQKLALSEMARVLAPGGIIGLTFDYGTGAPGVNAYLPPPHDPPATADEVRTRYVHSGLNILGDGRLDPPMPGSLFRSSEISYVIGALFLGKAPLPRPSLPSPVQRDQSVLSRLRIPDLPLRLHEKARRDLTAVEELKAFKEAAGDRLVALHEAHVELDRLYAELTLREEIIFKQKAHIQHLQSGE